MNTFSKYGNELLSKMGMKTTGSSGDSAASLPQSMKKAKFIKRFDMKVTTLQSYGLLRRDTPSPTQTSYSGSNPNARVEAGKKTEAKDRFSHVYGHNLNQVPARHVNEYPIDPNNVVASIHRNLNLQKQVALTEHTSFIESRDDENVHEANENDGRDKTSDSRKTNDENDFVLDDDCDSVDSIWNDCFEATCKLSVDDIYNDDELLGLAFIRD